jgi:hypothetical protein
MIKTIQFKHYNVNNFKSDIFAQLNDETFWNNTLDPNVSWENGKHDF